MKAKSLHPWSVSAQQAEEIQRQLAPRVKIIPLPDKIGCVGAAAVTVDKEDESIVAAAVVQSLPDFRVLAVAQARRKAGFPYSAGLFAFHAGPALLEALERLETEPEVILLPGHGIAHPRGLGLASHLGLLLERPSVGCAQRLLVGHLSAPVEDSVRGLVVSPQGEILAAALHTGSSRPLYVSPGHLTDLPSAVSLVRACTGPSRWPRPLQEARRWLRRLSHSPSQIME